MNKLVKKLSGWSGKYYLGDRDFIEKTVVLKEHHHVWGKTTFREEKVFFGSGEGYDSWVVDLDAADKALDEVREEYDKISEEILDVGRDMMNNPDKLEQFENGSYQWEVTEYFILDFDFYYTSGRLTSQPDIINDEETFYLQQCFIKTKELLKEKERTEILADIETNKLMENISEGVVALGEDIQKNYKKISVCGATYTLKLSPSAILIAHHKLGIEDPYGYNWSEEVLSITINNESPFTTQEKRHLIGILSTASNKEEVDKKVDLIAKLEKQYGVFSNDN